MRPISRFPATLLALPFALACVAATPAFAQDFPKLKAGQWETTTTSSKNPGAPGNKITICTDEAVQKQMMDMGKGMSKEMCSKSELHRDGGKYVGESVCKFGESTMTSHSVMTLVGDSSYKTVVTATYDPPLMGMKDVTSTIEGKNVGPCRDGLVPGDVLTATGQKFNMNSMPARPPVRPPAKTN